MKCNVLICESNDGFSAKLREQLQSNKISSQELPSLSQLSLTLKNLVNPILVFEIPLEKSQSEKYINEIANVKNIVNYPVIFVGDDASTHKAMHETSFSLSFFLNKPLNFSDLLSAINYANENFKFVDYSKTILIEPPKPAKKTGIGESDLDMPASSLYESFSSIPGMFFNKLSEYKLQYKNFLGKEYAKRISTEKYEKLFIEELGNEFDYFKDNFLDLPQYKKDKIIRIVFLTNIIISQINNDKKVLNTAIKTAFLFNWSYINENKNYLTKNYADIKSRVFRKELCSRIKDSAMKCALDANNRNISEIITLIAKFIGLEEAAKDDMNSLIASTIAVVDMVDRACFQNNFFNTRAAYKLMLMAKAGKLKEYHPLALCCVIKVLSEALSANLNMFLISKKERNDERLIAAKKNFEQLILTEGEKRVALSELEPGMKLTRPLLAYDGKEILSSDIKLDQDLIWRIWQLSMVRAMHSTLIVEH